MRLRQKFTEYKERAIALRREGNTYADIRATLGIPVPQSTLSEWLSRISLSASEKEKLILRVDEKLKVAQARSLEAHHLAREKYLRDIRDRVLTLPDFLEDKSIAKIALAMIYWCEGTKGHSSLSFGNSDPFLMKMFLALLRKCYEIDERKFRGTVQCRADQNVDDLKRYWMEITKIPQEQFYGARIDPRTIGKPTKKIDYKGVLKVDYFSADIYNELEIIKDLLSRGS